MFAQILRHRYILLFLILALLVSSTFALDDAMLEKIKTLRREYRFEEAIYLLKPISIFHSYTSIINSVSFSAFFEPNHYVCVFQDLFSQSPSHRSVFCPANRLRILERLGGWVL